MVVEADAAPATEDKATTAMPAVAAPIRLNRLALIDHTTRH